MKTQNRKLTAFWALAIFISASACTKDNITDDPIREADFRTKQYSNISKTTVTYSTQYNLKMDVYQPEDYPRGDRPVIVFAHGGAFVDGSRDLPDMQQICREMAKRGYVTASISYRLGSIFAFQDSNQVNLAVMRAIADGKAAIRYFRKSHSDGNSLGIDPDKIYVGGNSAGAVLMLHAAFAQENELPPYLENLVANEGGFEGQSGNPGYSSHVAGCINMAGGIKSTSFIDPLDPPVISFHGENDQVVPFDCAPIFQNLGNQFNIPLITLCGSDEIQMKAQASGLDAVLYAYPNQGHSPWLNNDNSPNELFRQMEDQIADFLADKVL